ncbi:MAG: hypothetical protein V1798_08125 [Pseudomonadota bacterium]
MNKWKLPTRLIGSFILSSWDTLIHLPNSLLGFVTLGHWGDPGAASTQNLCSAAMLGTAWWGIFKGVKVMAAKPRMNALRASVAVPDPPAAEAPSATASAPVAPAAHPETATIPEQAPPAPPAAIAAGEPNRILLVGPERAGEPHVRLIDRFRTGLDRLRRSEIDNALSGITQLNSVRTLFYRIGDARWSRALGRFEVEGEVENSLGHMRMSVEPGPVPGEYKLKVNLTVSNDKLSQNFSTTEVLAEMRNSVRRIRKSGATDFNLPVQLVKPRLWDVFRHGLPDMIKWEMDITKASVAFLNDLLYGPRLKVPARRAWANSHSIRNFYERIPYGQASEPHPLYDGSIRPVPYVRSEPVASPFRTVRRLLRHEEPVVIGSDLLGLLQGIYRLNEYGPTIARWGLKWTKLPAKSGRAAVWLGTSDLVKALGPVRVFIKGGRLRTSIRVEFSRTPIYLFEWEQLAELNAAAAKIRAGLEENPQAFQVRASVMPTSNLAEAPYPKGAVAAEFPLVPDWRAAIDFLDELLGPRAKLHTRPWREEFGTLFRDWVEAWEGGQWSEGWLELPRPWTRVPPPGPDQVP